MLQQINTHTHTRESTRLELSPLVSEHGVQARQHGEPQSTLEEVRSRPGQPPGRRGHLRVYGSAQDRAGCHQAGVQAQGKGQGSSEGLPGLAEAQGEQGEAEKSVEGAVGGRKEYSDDRRRLPAFCLPVVPLELLGHKTAKEGLLEKSSEDSRCGGLHELAMGHRTRHPTGRPEAQERQRGVERGREGDPQRQARGRFGGVPLSKVDLQRSGRLEHLLSVRSHQDEQGAQGPAAAQDVALRVGEPHGARHRHRRRPHGPEHCAKGQEPLGPGLLLQLPEREGLLQKVPRPGRDPPLLVRVAPAELLEDPAGHHCV
mmetsp:Transcript_9202/g.31795  ORF Transcript_9202/g.31795 Transcript_9202/m.31795 type:complete len:315 (-) Transcript_9202:934-1878(-)